MPLDLSQGQRTAIFQLIATPVVVLIFAPRFYAALHAGTFDGPDGLAAAAQLLLIAVLSTIVISIAVHILGTIALSILTGRGDVDDLTDERDRIFVRTGERLSHFTTGGFLILLLLLLWRGAPAPAALGILFLGCALGDIIANLYKLIRYARG